MHKTFPQFVPQDVCLKCDGCCRFADSDSSWRPKVSAVEGVDQNSLDEKGYLTTKVVGESCQCVHFNSENNQCGIYTNKPFECSIYPMLLIKNDTSIDVGVHLSCPHIQEYLGSDEFDQYVEQVKKYFQLESSAATIERNTFLAGEYPEHQNEIKTLFTLSQC